MLQGSRYENIHLFMTLTRVHRKIILCVERAAEGIKLELNGKNLVSWVRESAREKFKCPGWVGTQFFLAVPIIV